MSAIEDYLQRHGDEFLAELFELLRIPSVSADPDRAGDVERAAHWVADKLAAAGLTSEVVATEGHPIVYAESPHVAGRPTVLVYGHYDVQPADPLELWRSPPFKPEIRDDYLRGATDDKGQMRPTCSSARAWIEEGGGLPVNLKYLIEGEEVGSEAWPDYRRKHPAAGLRRDRRQRRASLCSAAGDHHGLRGSPTLKSRFAGRIAIPFRLAWRRSPIRGAGADAERIEAGRVQLPGFYDEVVPLPDEERRALAAAFDERQYLEQAGGRHASRATCC